jgi:hypothetical protein
MSVLRDVPAEPTEPDEPAEAGRVGPSRLADLINLKAWDLLGLTGQEFTRAWYAHEFQGDDRPEVAALDRLMRTGRWD